MLMSQYKIININGELYTKYVVKHTIFTKIKYAAPHLSVKNILQPLLSKVIFWKYRVSLKAFYVRKCVHYFMWINLFLYKFFTLIFPILRGVNWDIEKIRKLIAGVAWLEGAKFDYYPGSLALKRWYLNYYC